MLLKANPHSSDKQQQTIWPLDIEFYENYCHVHTAPVDTDKLNMFTGVKTNPEQTTELAEN